MTKRQSKVLRSTTPSTINTISVSEFVRGGLYNITEPTVVMSHSEELGTWYPRGQGMTANYMASSTTPSIASASSFLPGSPPMASTVSFTSALETAVETAVRRATEHLQSPSTTTASTTKGEGNTNG